MRRAFLAVSWLMLAGWALFLAAAWRLGTSTHFVQSRLIKDPERNAPKGDNLVAPADGTVLYVRRFSAGEVPLVIKERTAIPVEELLRVSDGEAMPPREGIIVGIYMNTFGVHINRAPLAGRVKKRRWYNGPHLDMTELERDLLLGALLPGSVQIKRLFGLAPEQIVSRADYITQSARETLVVEGALRCYVVRIADYYVGKVVSWVDEGDELQKGQKIGMITWGSQTDLLIETTPDHTVEIVIEEGDYLLAGETIVARYAGVQE